MKHNTIQATMAAAVYTLLRLPEVKARCALSRSEIYRRVGLGTFPAPVKLGSHANAHASAWVATEIESWVADRIAERDARSAE